MSTATLHEPETENAPPQLPTRLRFKDGLQPFADAKAFELTVVPDAPPFLRMECQTQDLAYILVDPFILVDDYRPDVSDSDLREIGLANGEMPLVLATVNIRHGVENATVNLAGPILVHPRTGQSKQTVLLNAAKYSCRHPIGH
jgi:flagellar assembly factor FliW